MSTLTFRSRTMSPYELLSDAIPARAAQRKRDLLGMSRLAEAQTLAAPDGALIVATLQESKHYTERTRSRYESLARRGVTVVLFAAGWTGVSVPEQNLHLAGLADDDAARHEWDLLVCSPRRRTGFAALDTGATPVDEMQRTFTWITTSDADALGRAVETLLMRVPTIDLRVPALAR